MIYYLMVSAVFFGYFLYKIPGKGEDNRFTFEVFVIFACAIAALTFPLTLFTLFVSKAYGAGDKVEFSQLK